MSYLKVYNNKEHDLVLNTPKRQELLTDGPPNAIAKRNILGRGSFGTVFKAIFQDKTVAVKIIKRQRNNIVPNEANIMHWEHCNIVKILKIETTMKFALVIMEYLDHGAQSLQHLLDTTSNLSITHRINILLDISKALSYCHAQQLLHLDVKPQNILICYKRNLGVHSSNLAYNRAYICKLCDFGSSLLWNTQNNFTCNARGTIRYMSPEALREELLTPSCDVYSLAITMWQMQTHQMPYKSIDCNDTVAYQVVKLHLRPDCIVTGEQKKVINELKRKQRIYLYRRSLMNEFNSDGIEMLFSQIVNCIEIMPEISTTLPMHWNNCNAARNLNFMFNINSSNESLESVYTKLYKSCWHSQPEMRLSLDALKERLAKLLSKCL